MQNNKQFILIAILILILIIICIFFYLKKTIIIEPFQWQTENKNQFLSLQSTMNPQRHFNMPIIEQQASEEEALGLLNTGYWNWTKNTEDLYMDAIAREPIIRLTPELSLQAAKKIYNENAIKKMLSWNTKEGQFLLSGGINNNKNVIKCFTNKDESSILKKIQINGYDLWNGYKNEKITNISNKDIPLEMPGFSFVGNPCNPCKALDNDYSCPFKLNVKGNDNVSNVWKNLWNI